MVKTLIALLCVCSLIPSLGQAKELPKTWAEIMKDASIIKSPSIEKLREQAIPKSLDGEYQLYVVADRFAFLFDPEGAPVIVFDLTMDQVGLGQAILGSLGIGQFSLFRLFKSYKEAMESNEKYMEMAEQMESDLGAQSSTRIPTQEDREVVQDEFAQFEFTDEFVAANFPSVASSGQKSGFRPTSFTLGDIRFSKRQYKELFKVMGPFSKLIFKEDLKEADLPNFMKQFKLDWNDSANDFTMVWDTNNTATKTTNAKKPKIPEWILNYEVPTDILAYKYYLKQIENSAQLVEYILGAYGRIATALVSKTVDAMKARLDSHENQLAALFEAGLKDQYKFDVPFLQKKKYLDASLSLLYTNKMIETPDITDGEQKRAAVYAEETENRAAVLKWLDKKNYTYKEWANGRMATYYKGDKRIGVISTAIKPTWLFKTPSTHYADVIPWGKTALRLTMEALVIGIRYFVPSQLSFEIPNLPIGISLYAPGFLWDLIFKGRSYTEIGYEGYAISELNAAAKGKYNGIAGYTKDEYAGLLKHMMVQRTNPFEIPAHQEAQAIKYNYKLLIDFLTGGKQQLTYVPAGM